MLLENWCATIAGPSTMTESHTNSVQRKHDFVIAVKKHLGSQAIEVLQPDVHGSNESHDEPQPQNVELDAVPVCQTQAPLPQNLAQLPAESDPLSIFVGLFGTIPRWVKDSVVQFAAYSGGYPRPEDAVYAAQQLNKAALYWNTKNVGVTFRWVRRNLLQIFIPTTNALFRLFQVGKLEDAAFVLGYAGDQGGLIARAYFPNANDLNNMTVYKRAFDGDLKPSMWNFFLHELGHVIGLRHEFAMDPPSMKHPKTEGGAVQIGSREELSVMNYEHVPMITKLDEETTTTFYNYPAGTTIKGVPLQLFVPNN
jgi:hypothetical protein